LANRQLGEEGLAARVELTHVINQSRAWRQLVG